MPANINTYIGRQAAWHALGTVTGKYQTWAEILAHGGLDFEVFKSQLHDGLGRKVTAWGTFRWNRADFRAYKMAERANDQQGMAQAKARAAFLGTVGEDYKVLNHASGFELVDELMQTTDGAHYETAGVLGSGEVVWGLADLGLRMNIGDDEHKTYLMFTTSHDGSISYQLRGCDERVVCANTLAIALGEQTKAVFKIRHTKSAQQRVTDAHKALECMSKDVKRMEDKLQFLVGRKVTRENLTTIMDRLFPLKKDEQGKDIDSTRRENILSAVLSCYEHCDGNAYPDQRGTAYNLLNAITEYTDHERSTRGVAGLGRAESALFGSGDKLKSQALEVILENAKAMPAMPSKMMSVPVGSFADLGLNVN